MLMPDLAAICGCQIKPVCSMQSQAAMTTPAVCPMQSQAAVVEPALCGCQMPSEQTSREACLCNMSLAMSYVLMQCWSQTYEPAVALARGTIFPELDLPFLAAGRVC